jgi:hypothetical protein
MLPIGLSSRGFQLDDYPARMTVLPDGRSIILTAQPRTIQRPPVQLGKLLANPIYPE